MITRVRVKNYRSLSDVDVELGPLTVLVGRNGAGKSTFIDALDFVKDTVRFGLKTARDERPMPFLSTRFNQMPIEFTIEVKDNGFNGEFGFTFTELSRNPQVDREKVRIFFAHSGTELAYERDAENWIVAPPNPFVEGNPPNYRPKIASDELSFVWLKNAILNFTYLSALLIGTNFISPVPDAYRLPQLPAHHYPLSSSGDNLVSVLLQMQKEEYGLPEIKTFLNRMNSEITDIRISQGSGFHSVEILHNGDWYSLADESDGTLRALAIATALYQDGPHYMVVIEEPEMNLHPGALEVLSDVIREASTRKQILLTTQSPDLISKFAPEELRVVERVDGATRISPLDERQIAILNDQLFSAGDLLRIEGLHGREEELAGRA